jgi:hypothetical protein
MHYYFGVKMFEDGEEVEYIFLGERSLGTVVHLVFAQQELDANLLAEVAQQRNLVKSKLL